jgi:large subunit ribosomal protein L32
MAVPKKKTSKARRDKRRANWKLVAPTMGECSRCHATKLPHQACPHCGYYKGRQVIKVEAKKKQA